MPQGMSQMTQTFFGGYRDELRKQGVPKKLDGTCCSFLSSHRRSNTTNAALQISSIFHRFDLVAVVSVFTLLVSV